MEKRTEKSQIRKLINSYFAKNKQANMDSEAARNKLTEHIVNSIQINEQKPSQPTVFHNS